jgi:hypothetical protein
LYFLFCFVVLCIVYSVFSVFLILNSVFCFLFSVFCILYSVFCILYFFREKIEKNKILIKVPR